MIHRFDADTDRCACGGLVVFFEDGDLDGLIGEGCEVSGRVWYGAEAIMLADEVEDAIALAARYLVAVKFDLENDDYAVPLDMAGEIIECDTNLLETEPVNQEVYDTAIEIIQRRIIDRFRIERSKSNA